MSTQKVTLKDIAAETGLSVNSVSLALRGVRVSRQTQLHVQQVADRLGYVGNAQATSIRTGSTRSIAVIVGDVSNPHTAQVLKECAHTLGAKGYSVIIYNTEEDETLEMQAIRSALRQNADGELADLPKDAFGKLRQQNKAVREALQRTLDDLHTDASQPDPQRTALMEAIQRTLGGKPASKPEEQNDDSKAD